MAAAAAKGVIVVPQDLVHGAQDAAMLVVAHAGTEAGAGIAEHAAGASAEHAAGTAAEAVVGITSVMMGRRADNAAA